MYGRYLSVLVLIHKPSHQQPPEVGPSLYEEVVTPAATNLLRWRVLPASVARVLLKRHTHSLSLAGKAATNSLTTTATNATISRKPTAKQLNYNYRN